MWLVYAISTVVVIAAVVLFIVRAVAPNELDRAFAQLWGFWCWTYIIRWKIRMASYHRVVNTVLGVVLAASIYVVIELCLIVTKLLFSENRYLPHLHTPWWLDGMVILLSLVVVRHHWSEWKMRSLDADMPQVIELLLREMDRKRDPVTSRWTPQAREEFLESLMAKMKEVLERNQKREVVFSLMELNAGGKLVIVFFHPASAAFEGNFSLSPKVGGAGVSYERKNSIYIPSTTHLMGIDIETNETIGQIYVPDSSSSGYGCVLCVPVISNTGVVTVLNVSCTKRSAFDLFEFRIGRLMAAMIAMIG